MSTHSSHISDEAELAANPWAAGSLLLALFVSLALAFVVQSGPLLRPYLSIDAIKSVPYARAVFTTLIDLIVFGVLLRVAGLSLREQALVTGIFEPIWKALAFGIVTFAPAVAICIAFVDLANDVSVMDLGWKMFVGPFTEELAFRGLAVGVLMRLCGWPLVAACLWPAVFFGIAHASQGSGWQEVAGIIAITSAGGLLFGWLFARWGYNLWPAIIVHCGLNGMWLLFDLGENAIGGWLGNGLRIGVVVLAIGVTLLMTRQSASAAPPR